MTSLLNLDAVRDAQVQQDPYPYFTTTRAMTPPVHGFVVIAPGWVGINYVVFFIQD